VCSSDLSALGVETVVRKTREVYLMDGARIHLDRVAGLSTFVEIEVLMERAGRGSARLMRELCERLRLPAASMTGSYRDLLNPESRILNPES
jgi:adenylate cyclase class IV